MFYLFDLAKVELEEARLNAFLNILAHKLDNGIRNHLASRNLLRADVRIKRCTGVAVESDNDAIRYGRDLRSPGVLWGFAEPRDGQLQSLIHLTSLVDRPISAVRPIPYDRDLSKMLELDRPVDDVYLAFSTFVLGQKYLEGKHYDMARRCFAHVQDLNPPQEILQAAKRELTALSSSPDLATDLEPVG